MSVPSVAWFRSAAAAFPMRKIAGVSPVRDLLQQRSARGRGEPGEQDESVAALLVQLRDPASGRPLPRARLWSEMSVRTLGTAWTCQREV